MCASSMPIGAHTRCASSRCHGVNWAIAGSVFTTNRATGGPSGGFGGGVYARDSILEHGASALPVTLGNGVFGSSTPEYRCIHGSRLGCHHAQILDRGQSVGLALLMGGDGVVNDLTPRLDSTTIGIIE